MRLLVLIIGSAVWLASSAATAGDDPRVVFVTSITGTPDLGSWVDAGGATGLAAGDAICQGRAAAGGLSNPENFVAWLSGFGDDAYCRLHGLTGKKSDNCGQGSLPESAGPWVRSDGFPFAPAIGELLAPTNAVFAPPWFDEFGQPTSLFAAPLTGTDVDGTVIDTDRTCDDWTSTEASPGPVVGSAAATSSQWTHSGGVSCSYSFASLLCMERVPGPALPDFAQGGLLAFVTSAAGNGNLASWPEADAGSGGIEAGDSICRNLAIGAGLPNASSFKAFLSDTSTNAIDRFDSDGPWVRPDGVLVAADKADLTDDTLFTAITVDESGSYLPASDFFHVWTGTNPDGSGSAGHCSDWTVGSNLAQGRFGRSTVANSLWMGGNPSNPPTDCDASFALYCLSDLAPNIFSDRFEN